MSQSLYEAPEHASAVIEKLNSAKTLLRTIHPHLPVVVSHVQALLLIPQQTT